jgi:hypothetical protein
MAVAKSENLGFYFGLLDLAIQLVEVTYDSIDTGIVDLRILTYESV